MNKTVSGIIRCLKILESRCGKRMCAFTLDGDKNHEVVVLPLCYADHAGLIEHGARIEVEGEESQDRMLALAISKAGES
jgi:hypothetical protein